MLVSTGEAGKVMHSKIDRYVIHEVLGQGGMGVVYKAYDSQRKGYVALKTMKDAADAAALELFNQEWRILANISHPNIVDVLNVGEFEDNGQRKPYFVMPLLPGKTLDKLIRESGHRLSVDRVIEILVQTCRGLQAAHASGLIHRDLKPSNLFVLSDDSVKIIDFGMVHLADVAKSATGLKGTLQYMAPEQLELKEITPATDIFAVGVVAYEALTGRKPFNRPTERAIAEAIRREFPPPASDLNPTVNKTLAQVIAKAMAKNPWNRFSNARELGEYLQRAAKGETIEAFEAVKIQPRIERARRALNEGDFEYADEILNELQLEGHVDTEIGLLLERVKEAARNKIVRQLLDSARTRLEEEEFPLAWQKVQEALQREPGNREALALQAEIETRRSDQQIEKWRRLVQQHLHNHAFTQARHAIEEIRKIRPDDPQIPELEQLADDRQKQYEKVCESKEQHFQSAMRAYGNGEISTALSKLEKILEVDSRMPGFAIPGRDELYRETYNKIRSEWEEVQHAVAEIERVIASGDLARAAEIAAEHCAKYPNDLSLQTLKLKVEDLMRREKSEYIAETTRRVEDEPDLDRRVQYLEEAIARYPKEPHFEELAASLRKRRDLVNSIVAKARQYEEQGLVNESLGQWLTLRNIHPKYPGLDFEIERIQQRCEQQRQEEARLNLVSQIDALLQSSEYERALALAAEALDRFPADQELQTLKRLAQEGCERSAEAAGLMEEAQAAALERRHEDALAILRRAAALDPNNAAIRARLADMLIAQAQPLVSSDWRTAEELVQEAMHLAPEHPLARSLRPSILLARRTEFIDQCVAASRELQAAGDLSAALGKVQEGLAVYPNDGRLVQLHNTLRKSINDQARLQKTRDVEELKELSRQVHEPLDQTSLTALLERSVVLSRLYPDDSEVHALASDIEKAAGQSLKPKAASAAAGNGGAASAPPGIDEAPERRWTERPQAAKAESTPVFDRARNLAAGKVLPVLRRGTESLSAAILAARSMFGHLSWKQRAAVAATPVVIVGAIIVAAVISRRSGPPAPAEAPAVLMTFTTNIAGANISVNGNPVHDGAARLAGGSYQARASKLGYKTAVQSFTVGTQPANVALTLEPEPQSIRLFTGLRSGKVLLDNVEVGELQDGNFSHELTASGVHTLKLLDGRSEVFSLEFEITPGTMAHLVKPPSGRVPVAVVSSLGNQAVVMSSAPEAKATLKSGAQEAIPAEGRQFTLQPVDDEITFEAGAKPVSVPIEIGNAPSLTIEAGFIDKGTLMVEANVDEADVYVNGRKSTRPLRRSRWVTQLEPGEYRVRLAAPGYEEAVEQRVVVEAGRRSAPLRFVLSPVVTVAYLRIENGTPEAEVVVDGSVVGESDASGSFGPLSVAPDVEHTIRLQKQDYESVEIKKGAAAKDTILLSGPAARLKQLGILTVSGAPADAVVSIARAGSGTERKMTNTTERLPEGDYTVRATGDRYRPFSKDVHISSGQQTTVAINLVRIANPTTTTAEPSTVKDLFRDPRNWREENGFWIHDGTVWLKAVHFHYQFDVLRFKKDGWKEVSWRTFTKGDDFIEFKLDGKHYFRRAWVGGKRGKQVRIAHKLDSDIYRLDLTVRPDGIIVKVGKAEDTIPVHVEGLTGFDYSFGLRFARSSTRRQPTLIR